MTRKDQDFDGQMAVARERMDKHKVALSVLAQGENSPYWTEDLSTEIEAAKIRLEKYRSSKQGL
jgi:phytoene/squalene synthetase